MVPATLYCRLFAGGVDRQTRCREPVLLRNYDFAPRLLEGSWLATRWTGQRVAALGDCIWGALDGMNEAGLAACLSFGGRTVSGTGFGIPLVLRYVLEVAHDTADARRPAAGAGQHVLHRHAARRRRHWATVFVSPDRPTEVTRHNVVTNFQHAVEWEQHARATHAVERRLPAGADRRSGTAADAIAALLQPPLYQTSWLRGYGTLYSAAYRPRSGLIELMWPGMRWEQRLSTFAEGSRRLHYNVTSPA